MNDKATSQYRLSAPWIARAEVAAWRLADLILRQPVIDAAHSAAGAGGDIDRRAPGNPAAEPAPV